MNELTERESAILRYICQGCNNKEIGEFLYLSPNTVKVYISSILKKFGVENRTLVAFIAGQLSLVDFSQMTNIKGCH